MLERISLKVGLYESTGYQRVFHRFQGGDSLGGDDLVGNFFFGSKEKRFYDPPACNVRPGNNQGMRCSVYTCILSFL